MIKHWNTISNEHSTSSFILIIYILKLSSKVFGLLYKYVDVNAVNDK